MRFLLGQKTRRKSHRWLIVLICLLVLLGVVGLAARGWYETNLAAVNSQGSARVTFTVQKGNTPTQIANQLKQAKLIKNSQAFRLYLRFRGLTDKLQAGTYSLSPSMGTSKIATILSNGYVSKDYVTILPGKTLKQIKQAFEQSGYSDSEVEAAFNPANYSDLILLKNLPAGNSLEGLLYPDSFQKEAATPASTIVRESLQEMQNSLTPDIISGFAAQGLTPYQGLTMASIVYQESGDPSSEPTVAQVFLLRLKKGMALGSDVTAFYAADLAGEGQTLGVDSPYNTRIHTGIPPGPIGSFTVTAMNAVAHPSNTDYLFFVAGDNGVIHFTHTEAEHEQAVKQYCTKECS
jgi:UPF0755 protein